MEQISAYVTTFWFHQSVDAASDSSSSVQQITSDSVLTSSSYVTAQEGSDAVVTVTNESTVATTINTGDGEDLEMELSQDRYEVQQAPLLEAISDQAPCIPAEYTESVHQIEPEEHSGVAMEIVDDCVVVEEQKDEEEDVKLDCDENQVHAEVVDNLEESKKNAQTVEGKRKRGRSASTKASQGDGKGGKGRTSLSPVTTSTRTSLSSPPSADFTASVVLDASQQRLDQTLTSGSTARHSRLSSTIDQDVLNSSSPNTAENRLSGGSDAHYIRRSTRDPSVYLMEKREIQDLFVKIRTNHPDTVVLKIKDHILADINSTVMESIIDALWVNEVCEGLYIQNLDKAITDVQMKRLIALFKQKMIWCLNIGENYEISNSMWEEFCQSLPETNITHLYASEHVIDINLKNRMRDYIRENRKKHNKHCSIDNLAVIEKCTHMWWNPINGVKELKPQPATPSTPPEKDSKDDDKEKKKPPPKELTEQDVIYWKNRVKNGQMAEWEFKCTCGQQCRWSDSYRKHPIGRMFQCSACDIWCHVDCVYGSALSDDDLEKMEEVLCTPCKSHIIRYKLNRIPPPWKFKCKCLEVCSHYENPLYHPVGAKYACTDCGTFSHVACMFGEKVGEKDLSQIKDAGRLVCFACGSKKRRSRGGIDEPFMELPMYTKKEKSRNSLGGMTVKGNASKIHHADAVIPIQPLVSSVDDSTSAVQSSSSVINVVEEENKTLHSSADDAMEIAEDNPLTCSAHITSPKITGENLPLPVAADHSESSASLGPLSSTPYSNPIISTLNLPENEVTQNSAEIADSNIVPLSACQETDGGQESNPPKKRGRKPYKQQSTSSSKTTGSESKATTGAGNKKDADSHKDRKDKGGDDDDEDDENDPKKRRKLEANNKESEKKKPSKEKKKKVNVIVTSGHLKDIEFDWVFKCCCGEKCSYYEKAVYHPKGLKYSCTNCPSFAHVLCMFPNEKNIAESLPYFQEALCFACKSRKRRARHNVDVVEESHPPLVETFIQEKPIQRPYVDQDLPEEEKKNDDAAALVVNNEEHTGGTEMAISQPEETLVEECIVVESISDAPVLNDEVEHVNEDQLQLPAASSDQAASSNEAVSSSKTPVKELIGSSQESEKKVLTYGKKPKTMLDPSSADDVAHLPSFVPLQSVSPFSRPMQGLANSNIDITADQSNDASVALETEESHPHLIPTMAPLEQSSIVPAEAHVVEEEKVEVQQTHRLEVEEELDAELVNIPSAPTEQQQLGEELNRYSSASSAIDELGMNPPPNKQSIITDQLYELPGKWTFSCKCKEVCSYYEKPRYQPRRLKYSCMDCGVFSHAECNYGENVTIEKLQQRPILLCLSCLTKRRRSRNAERRSIDVIPQEHKKKHRKSIPVGSTVEVSSSIQQVATDVGSARCGAKDMPTAVLEDSNYATGVPSLLPYNKPLLPPEIPSMEGHHLPEAVESFQLSTTAPPIVDGFRISTPVNPVENASSTGEFVPIIASPTLSMMALNSQLTPNSWPLSATMSRLREVKAYRQGEEFKLERQEITSLTITEDDGALEGYDGDM